MKTIKIEYTHEPWEWKEEQTKKGHISHYIMEGLADDPQTIAQVVFINGAEENAKRIVACVNACEGINPEAVSEMLEACEYALVTLDNAAAFLKNPIAYDSTRDSLRAAIAKAKGETCC